MTSQLSLVTSEVFEGNSADFYSDSDTYFMTAKQLSQCLGYASKTAFDSLLSRNKYLNNEEFSTTCKMQVVEGNRTVTRNMRLFSEDGIYEIAFLSKTAVAQMFRAWVRKILKELRKQTQNKSQQLTISYTMLDQSVYHLQQSMQNTIDCVWKQGLQLGEHEDRIENLEKLNKNYMLNPIYQMLSKEIVRLGNRYYRLNQENKAIRTALNLHYKEHDPEAYSKPTPNKSKSTKPASTYFNSMELLFNDMKDQYQSFTTSYSGSPAIKNTMIYRIVEIEDNSLHFQVNRTNLASMDIYDVIKAEKKIVDSRGVAEYKLHCKGGTESIIFTAVPKRLLG